MQDRKQPISPHLQFKLRLATQQVVRLSGTQTRPTLTFLLNEVGNFLIQNQTSCIGAIAFAVSLSAYPQALASPADAQVLDWFMREELPGRFFYDRETIGVFQDIHDRLEKLRFLIGKRQLFFKHL